MKLTFHTLFIKQGDHDGPAHLSLSINNDFHKQVGHDGSRVAKPEPAALCGIALKSRDLNHNPLVTSMGSSMI